MSDESIIKKVASAIWRQRVETAAKNGVDLSKDDEEFMIAANSIVDEARAAIQAYETAKREDLHRVLMNTSKQLSPAVFDDYTASQNMRTVTPIDAAYLSAMMRVGFKP